MDDQEQVIELYRQYWKCMVGKDLEGLVAIMADDYELAHMTGKRQGKESFFASLESGELNYYSAEHDEITPSITDDTATLVGKSKVVAAVYGGGKREWSLRGDFTLRKEDGKWRLVSSRASTY